jgi:hypothetical protein
LENFPELVLDTKSFWVKPEVFNGSTIIYGVVLLVHKSLDSILSSLINKLNITKYPKNFWEKKGCLVEGAELIFGDIQQMLLGNDGLFIAEIYFKENVIDGRSSAIILQGQISDLIKVGTFINRFVTPNSSVVIEGCQFSEKSKIQVGEKQCPTLGGVPLSNL